jgi:phosphate starvation-inducible protein PhoH and related proteins
MGKHRESLYEKNNNKMNLSLIDVQPLSDNQEDAFDEWDNDKNLVLYGYAGTGKTFIALFLALQAIQEKNSPQKKVVIIRSAVPSRDMGFLPGSQTEKGSAYEEPYEAMVNTLFGRGDAYTLAKRAGMIEFRTTSYLRGLTYDRSIIIVDEIQNMVDAELNTILTRLGENSKLILCGDFRQIDLTREKSGMGMALKVLKRMSNWVKFIEFGINDIIRSDFVKQYIIQREKVLEHEKNSNNG